MSLVDSEVSQFVNREQSMNSLYRNERVEKKVQHIEDQDDEWREMNASVISVKSERKICGFYRKKKLTWNEKQNKN